jgi:outer membrane lipoprotein-sorting protein
MINMKKLKFVFLFLLICFTVSVSGQSKDPDDILDRVKAAFIMIEDYEVDIQIKVDVDFLKVPDSEAKLYFKFGFLLIVHNYL